MGERIAFVPSDSIQELQITPEDLYANFIIALDDTPEFKQAGKYYDHEKSAPLGDFSDEERKYGIIFQKSSAIYLTILDTRKGFLRLTRQTEKEHESIQISLYSGKKKVPQESAPEVLYRRTRILPKKHKSFPEQNGLPAIINCTSLLAKLNQSQTPTPVFWEPIPLPMAS